MLDRSRILTLIPHQGRMCLLDRVEHWSADGIECTAISHRDPDHPLRRNGRLHAIAGVEYGLQAAAAHGALMDGAPQAAGYLASLRTIRLAAAYLDDQTVERLTVRAAIPLRERHGLVVTFAVLAGAAELVCGRASIFIPG